MELDKSRADRSFDYYGFLPSFYPCRKSGRGFFYLRMMIFCPGVKVPFWMWLSDSMA